METINLLPFSAAIVTFVFTGMVLQRYFFRPSLHLLFWTLGLGMYGLATFAEAFLAVSWSPLAFQLWYLCGAVLTAAWLGQGTIFLLIRKRRITYTLMGLLLAGSLFALVTMLTTPLDAAAYSPTESLTATYKAILPEGARIRMLTPFFNIYGTLGLVGGAIYSAWLFWRKRVLPHRVVGNVLIAIGGMSPALGGTLARLNLSEFLYVSELLGAVVMLAGFIVASSPDLVRRPAHAHRAEPAT